MRIVSGKYRGTNIAVPDIAETRPTMDRTRQAIFNILRSAAWALNEKGETLLNGAHVLDVFAGSGAMGFEALSQGAASAQFFEQQPQAIEAIEKNRIKMRCEAVTTIVKGDVFKTKMTGKAAQVAFFDPPYQQDLLQRALETLQARGLIDGNTLLVLEMHKAEQLPPGLVNGCDMRLYGLSKIVFGKLNV